MSLEYDSNMISIYNSENISWLMFILFSKQILIWTRTIKTVSQEIDGELFAI